MVTGKEVTGDSAFSMFNLSLKDDWYNNKKFCHRLSEEDVDSHEHGPATMEAQERLDANKSRQGSPNTLSAAVGFDSEILNLPDPIGDEPTSSDSFIPVQ